MKVQQIIEDFQGICEKIFTYKPEKEEIRTDMTYHPMWKLLLNAKLNFRNFTDQSN